MLLLNNYWADNTKYRELNVAIHVIFIKKKELIKSVKKYLLYEILCKELARRRCHSLSDAGRDLARGSEITVGSLRQFAE